VDVALNVEKGIGASGGEDGSIRLWNLDFLRRGRKFWDVFAKKQSFYFRTNCGKIRALDLSLDGRNLLAGYENKEVLLWSLENPHTPPAILKGHRGAITGVALSADGKWAISTSNSPRQNVFLWDLSQRRKVISFTGTRDGVCKMAVVGNAHWLFLATEKGQIHVWDLKGKKAKVAILQNHSSEICDLCGTFQGEIVLSGGNDGSLEIWKNDFVWPIIREQKYLKILPKNSKE